MKKNILSIVAALIGATATQAQSSLLATLTHETTTTIYYGTTALSTAMTAAADGDVITLSSGTFTAVNIDKAVTLRGAGMTTDAQTQSEPTILSGGFDVTSGNLTIEGVYCNDNLRFSCSTAHTTLAGITLLKCRFNQINIYNEPKLENLTMIHCKVASSMKTASGSSVSLLNCIVWEPSIGGQWEFTNCVIKRYNVGATDISNSTFKNCVFVGCANSVFNSSNTLFNCVAMNSEGWNLFSNVSNTTNQVLSDYTTIFKNCTSATYSDSETFELTDAAANIYKGSDGQQIGIYGGNLPFDMKTSNPRITHADVDAKSDANGNLKINITVQGAE